LTHFFSPITIFNQKKGV